MFLLVKSYSKKTAEAVFYFSMFIYNCKGLTNKEDILFKQKYVCRIMPEAFDYWGSPATFTEFETIFAWSTGDGAPAA